MEFYVCLEIDEEDGILNLPRRYGMHDDVQTLIDSHAKQNTGWCNSRPELGDAPYCGHSIALVCLSDEEYVLTKLDGEFEDKVFGGSWE